MSAPVTSAAPAHSPAGAFSSILLIAGRDITARIRQRTFLIATGVLVLVALGAPLLLNAVGAGGPSSFTIGVTQGASGEATSSLAEGLGIDVELQDVSDRAAGEALLTEGELDALLVPGDTVSVVVEQELDPQLATLFAQQAQNQAFEEVITAAGGDPAEVSVESRRVV